MIWNSSMPVNPTTTATWSVSASPYRTRSRNGLSISPSVSAHVRRHAGPNPLFQKTRSDRQLRIATHVLHRALQYEGFAPYIGYSFEWNHSNIPINTYRNHGVAFGISRAF